MSRDVFIKGALILTIAGFIVKIIGAANRIILSRVLGGEGIGLYQMAYPIYTLALSISSAGIPVAISILVAEKIARGDYRGAKRIFNISFGVLSVTGVVFSILLYYGAGWLIDSNFIRDQRAYYAIVALSPAIFFVTIMSSFRGYFQGLQQMTPTANSQIVEQFIRVVVMLILAITLLSYGLEYGAAGASFGAAPGAAAGLIVLVYYFFIQRKGYSEKIRTQPDIKQESSIHIIGRIVKLALPVSLANIMLPIVANIDLLIVPTRLEVAGYTTEQATELFGYLTGMAASLINLPTILTASLAIGLVPAVSEAFTLGNKQSIYHRTAMAMRIANLITIPSFVGLWLLATPISQMLYGTPNAGMPIAVLSIGIVLLGWHQVTTGVLQGLGHTTIPLINMVASAAVKIVLNWELTAIPILGIKGAAWATNADFGIAALLNMYFVYRYVGFTMDWGGLLKTIIASAMMGVTVLVVYDFMMIKFLSNTLATLGGISIGIMVYSLATLLIGGVSEREITSIPKVGAKFAKLLKRMGLLRR